MKKLSTFLGEQKGDPINDDWINNERQVIIKRGNQAIIVDIDMGQVPNIYIGKVKYKDKLVDYKWDDTGKCISAQDQYGSPVQPTEDDDLVQGD